MSSSHSVVCCAHGAPCITGNFASAFEGLHLSDLDRRRGRSDNEAEPLTAYCRSTTARSTTTRSSSLSSAHSTTSTVYENHEASEKSEEKKTKKKHSGSGKRVGRSEEKSEGGGGDDSSGKTGSRGGIAVKTYIGLLTADKAERIVMRATDFKIYHQLGGERDIGSLHANLPLYIVYRSTKNTARHIPIKTVVENKRRFLSAGGGSGRDNKRLLFETIDALVKYYKTYVQLQPQGNPGMVDVFPA